MLVLSVVECGAAEVQFHPSLAVSEEFTDNVFLTEHDKVSEYITRVLPGFSLAYQAPVLTGDISYTFDYRHYARGTQSDEITHSADAKGLLTVHREKPFCVSGMGDLVTLGSSGIMPVIEGVTDVAGQHRRLVGEREAGEDPGDVLRNLVVFGKEDVIGELLAYRQRRMELHLGGSAFDDRQDQHCQAGTPNEFHSHPCRSDGF